ncbi:DUF445 domain-containing protein [Flavitalea sp.]|nr:hypothetical protein [Flavitalea sp.]
MLDLTFLLFLVSGALIGWLAGWILSRIFIGIALNQKRAILSEQLASFVSSKIISPDQMLEKVAKPEHFLKLMPVIEHHIDDFLRNRLKTAIPMIGMLIGERTISQLKTVFMQELEVIFPEVLKKYVTDLAENFDFKAEFRQRLLAIPPATIEAVLYPVGKKLFCIVGIVSGLATGLINLVIYFF